MKIYVHAYKKTDKIDVKDIILDSFNLIVMQNIFNLFYTTGTDLNVSDWDREQCKLKFGYLFLCVYVF